MTLKQYFLERATASSEIWVTLNRQKLYFVKLEKKSQKKLKLFYLKLSKISSNRKIYSKIVKFTKDIPNKYNHWIHSK